MGTHTIVGILYNNLKKLKNIKTLVIQSNNDDYFLRYKLTKIGFKIEEETLVEDAKIIYTITNERSETFDKFFSDTVAEEEFANMLEAFEKKNLYTKEIEGFKITNEITILECNNISQENDNLKNEIESLKARA